MQTESNFASALANPSIRSSIKKFALEIKWNSPLAQKIVEFFTSDKVKGGGKVPDAVLRAHFSTQGLLDEEIEKVIERCHTMAELGTNIDAVVESFSMFYQEKMVGLILEETNKGDQRKAAEIVRRMRELPKIESNVTPVKILGNLDVAEVLKRELGDNSTLPSRFDLIRRVCPSRGYLKGQVIQVCGAPGTGKSLFLMNEAVTMAEAGFKGYYIALGDLSEGDFITRFSSMITGTPLSTTQLHPQSQWTENVQSILKNLKITTVNPGHLDAESLVDVIESRVQPEGNLDFVMVDYDTNFAKSSDNMYAEGDSVYNCMSDIAKPKHSTHRVVFIACQPKPFFWDKEKLPLEASAESSRKQAIVDIMVTLGKNREATQKCGIMNIAKNRRGESDQFAYYTMGPNGSLNEIEQGEYNLLKRYTSEDSNSKSSYGGKKQYNNNYQDH